MTVSQSMLLERSIHILRCLGWAWRWAEWWVEWGWGGDDYDNIVDSTTATKASRLDDANKCRLEDFGASLRNRSYDDEQKGSAGKAALDRALRAVLSIPNLVGRMNKKEIDFVTKWLGQAYRSKSPLLGFGPNKIAVADGAYLREDNHPKQDLGKRSLPGKEYQQAVATALSYRDTVIRRGNNQNATDNINSNNYDEDETQKETSIMEGGVPSQLSPRKLFLTATPLPKQQQHEQKLKDNTIVNLDTARGEDCKNNDEDNGKTNPCQSYNEHDKRLHCGDSDDDDGGGGRTKKLQVNVNIDNDNDDDNDTAASEELLLDNSSNSVVLQNIQISEKQHDHPKAVTIAEENTIIAATNAATPSAISALEQKEKQNTITIKQIKDKKDDSDKLRNKNGNGDYNNEDSSTATVLETLEDYDDEETESMIKSIVLVSKISSDKTRLRILPSTKPQQPEGPELQEPIVTSKPCARATRSSSMHIPKGEVNKETPATRSVATKATPPSTISRITRSAASTRSKKAQASKKNATQTKNSTEASSVIKAGFSLSDTSEIRITASRNTTDPSSSNINKKLNHEKNSCGNNRINDSKTKFSQSPPNASKSYDTKSEAYLKQVFPSSSHVPDSSHVTDTNNAINTSPPLLPIEAPTSASSSTTAASSIKQQMVRTAFARKKLKTSAAALTTPTSISISTTTSSSTSAPSVTSTGKQKSPRTSSARKRLSDAMSTAASHSKQDNNNNNSKDKAPVTSTKVIRENISNTDTNKDNLVLTLTPVYNCDDCRNNNLVIKSTNVAVTRGRRQAYGTRGRSRSVSKRSHSTSSLATKTDDGEADETVASEQDKDRAATAVQLASGGSDTSKSTARKINQLKTTKAAKADKSINTCNKESQQEEKCTKKLSSTPKVAATVSINDGDDATTSITNTNNSTRRSSRSSSRNSSRNSSSSNISVVATRKKKMSNKQRGIAGISVEGNDKTLTDQQNSSTNELPQPALLKNATTATAVNVTNANTTKTKTTNTNLKQLRSNNKGKNCKSVTSSTSTLSVEEDKAKDSSKDAFDKKDKHNDKHNTDTQIAAALNKAQDTVGATHVFNVSTSIASDDIEEARVNSTNLSIYRNKIAKQQNNTSDQKLSNRRSSSSENTANPAASPGLANKDNITANSAVETLHSDGGIHTKNDKRNNKDRINKRSSEHCQKVPETIKKQGSSCTATKKKNAETEKNSLPLVSALSPSSKSAKEESSDSVRIVVTNIELTKQYERMIKSIKNATLVTKLEEIHTATHVIAADDSKKKTKYSETIRRTPKFMICLCVTSQILYSSWLDDSSIAGHALPTALPTTTLSKQQRSKTHHNYLLLGDTEAERRYKFRWHETFQNGERLRKKRYIAEEKKVRVNEKESSDAGRTREKGGGLLWGWSVYFAKGVAGNRAPARHELHLIVEAAGGIMMSKLPKINDCKNNDRVGSDALIIITSDPITVAQKKEIQKPWCGSARRGGGYDTFTHVYNTTWLFDCIIRQDLRNLEDYHDSTNNGDMNVKRSPPPSIKTTSQAAQEDIVVVKRGRKRKGTDALNEGNLTNASSSNKKCPTLASRRRKG
eukprot:CAMPEP_0194367674 /NCGR_PEP_ID=MMETSP0174-20130528/15807_1 /TAXON_ID=216777 /ORGANISM="Proboscia alata, Strain PI-D3" /LENGTH=1580 /DNA_ID=CAMNT_0039143593 /DNA_START=134 /DNA_END=4876 /DNA_ORIENTATION=-